ncbi:MAG TPA: hypothetical protein VJR89_30820 [Polyangiales bacterium]|nr:hypothetical protein [Polyangiales bacterium]
MRSFVVIAVFMLACSAGRAAASPLFELVGDVAEQGGLNARASAPGAASSYFNPALLPDATPGVVIGVFLLSDSIDIDLAGRTGGDVPSSFRGATHADGRVFEDPSVPTRWLREGCAAPECPLPLDARPRQAAGTSHNTRFYQAIGLVVPLVQRQLAFGFYGLIPLGTFTTAHSFFADEREQFFTNSLHAELYSDRLTAPSLAFGLGARLAKPVSLGVGATLSLRNAASADTFVGNPDELDRTLILSTDVGVKVGFAPHFGLTVKPLDVLALSATLHTVSKLEIESGISTFLPDGNRQTVTRATVHDYMPIRVAFGARWDVLGGGDALEPTGQHALALSAGAVLGLWSNYTDRHGETPSSDYAWDNTLSFVAGARYSFAHLRSYLDAAYVPTPTPPQTGRTNYVENDRISTAAGIDYDFELFALRLRAGLSGQLHFLQSRSQSKIDALVRDEFPDDAVDTRGDPIPESAGLQTNNPGWPGFSSSGMLFAVGVNLALLLP